MEKLEEFKPKCDSRSDEKTKNLFSLFITFGRVQETWIYNKVVMEDSVDKQS